MNKDINKEILEYYNLCLQDNPKLTKLAFLIRTFGTNYPPLAMYDLLDKNNYASMEQLLEPTCEVINYNPFEQGQNYNIDTYEDFSNFINSAYECYYDKCSDNSTGELDEEDLIENQNRIELILGDICYETAKIWEAI